MENTQVYIKTDDNKIINEKHIRWVKKFDDCLEVCTRSKGCGIKYGGGTSGTHRICKLNNVDSFNKLNKHFE